MELKMVYHENGGNESFEVGGSGYGGGVMSTLKSLSNPSMSYDFMLFSCYENHANDSRVCTSGDGHTSQTIVSRMGTGGGNLPLVHIGRKE